MLSDDIFEKINLVETLVNDEPAPIAELLSFTLENMTQIIRPNSKQVNLITEMLIITVKLKCYITRQAD